MEKLFKVSFIYFMPIYMLMSFLLMLKSQVYIIIWYPVLIMNIVHAVKLGISSKNNISLLVSSFIIYSILTFIYYSFNNTPIDCYFNGVRAFVIPILFFYLGCFYSYSDKYQCNYIWSCLFCFLIGFYLFFSAPDFYREFLTDVANSSWYNVQRSEDAIFETARFSSFFRNSYAIEFLGVPLLILAYDRALNNNNIRSKILLYLVTIVAVIAIFLSMQRAAILFSVVFIMVYSFYIQRKNHKSIIGIVALLSLLFILVGYLFFFDDRITSIFEFLASRFDGINISAESHGRILEFDRDNTLSTIFGLGLGSSGQFAGEKGLQAIFDMEYVKDFYEFGLVGLTLYVLIFLLTLVRGLSHFYKYRVEMSVILFFLLCGLISNALTQYINNIFFWYCVGCVWNKNQRIQLA